MRRLEGRVAVVTGAASGIGRATSALLARKGCHLALVDLNEDGLAETAALVRAADRKVSIHLADVADKERMRALPEEVIREHGHVHLLMNNAGVALASTIEEHDLDDLEWIVGINFWGVVYGCKFFLPYLRREEEGHIVNLSSMFAFMGLPTQGAYCATKFAVRALSETLWSELADSAIHVTSVHPGVIKTNLVEAGRFRDAESRQSAAELMESWNRTPEQAAAKIVRAIEKNKLRVLIGREAYFFDWIKRLSPVLTHRMLAWRYRRQQRQPAAQQRAAQ